ncbi:HipA N-terminal domain-containing protein [Legionella brunensis]|uniref:HipA N-terminal domain-containing protein n=1 Tax=Legionella brunensis TaxID=29422 RepID=UPI0007316C4F|nr:HipA N-terminal domain-containing protein [Legionella brunensis]
MKSYKLDVYLHQTRIGQLVIDTSGNMSFVYDENYLKNEDNQPLSHSLPLQKTPYITKQKPLEG